MWLADKIDLLPPSLHQTPEVKAMPHSLPRNILCVWATICASLKLWSPGFSFSFLPSYFSSFFLFWEIMPPKNSHRRSSTSGFYFLGKPSWDRYWISLHPYLSSEPVSQLFTHEISHHTCISPLVSDSPNSVHTIANLIFLKTLSPSFQYFSNSSLFLV